MPRLLYNEKELVLKAQREFFSGRWMIYCKISVLAMRYLKMLIG